MTFHRLKKHIGRLSCLPVAAAVTLLAGPSFAQNDQPNWLSVAVVQVKPGHAPDFEALLADLLQAQQDEGRPGSQVFEIALGNAGEFHVVTPVASIAATETAPPPMDPAEMTQWTSRVTQHLESARFFYAALHPEHAIQTDAGGSAELLVLQTIRTVAGSQDEYAEWVADFLMPALRDSDVAGHTLSTGLFGDSPQNFYHAFVVRGWSELDQPNPLQRSLGQRAYEQLLDRNEGMVESVNIAVARVRSDLMPGN